MELHVAIIGGGVVGLSVAYELVCHGARVTVLDAGGIGQESSWAGAGIIPPGNPQAARDPLARLRATSARLHATWADRLREETGIDNGYRQCGGLEVAFDSRSTADLKNAAALYAEEQIPHERLSTVQARKLERALSPEIGEALHLPTLAQIRNPRHVKALTAAIARRGGEIRPGTPVVGFERESRRVTAVRTLADKLCADAFVLATGAWSQSLLAEFGLASGIKPIRGQIVLLSTTVPLIERVLLVGNDYLVPRTDGRVLVGSTEEDVGFDKRTTSQAIHGLLSTALRLVPNLAGAHFERAWAGLRPGSPTGGPYIGRVADLDNLFVAAGHFRAGLSLSPGTAVLVRELVLGQCPSIPLDAFCLKRATC